MAKWLVGVGALALLLWFGWSLATVSALRAGLAPQEGARLRVSHEAINTSGFPMQLATQISALSVADPRAGWAVEMAQLDLRQPSYQPQSVVADLGEDLHLTLPGEALTLRAARQEALLHIAPLDDLALVEAGFDFEAAALTSSRGWQATLGAGRLRLTPVEGAVYALTYALSDLAPDAGLLGQIDPMGQHPRAFQAISGQARLHLDRRLDRHIATGAEPRLTRIELSQASAHWGEMSVVFSGDLVIGADGVPSGTLAIEAENWPQMLTLASQAGLLSAPVEAGLEAGLAQLSSFSGRPEHVATELLFDQGYIWFGTIAIAPAPRF